MIFRSQLIHWALRLQWPPCIWLFHFYYWLAIQFSRWLASRIEGVKSIYLSGSWVRQDVIYGLSDIDFKVFVAGDKNQEIYQSIRRRFSFLRRFFPMLGPPDEKGIYFLKSFDADYRHYPLVQHLFDVRFFRHRLVWGKDLWDILPITAWKELDQGECVFARLKDWIERIHLLADCAELSRAQKQHLFFKAASDVGLLAIRIDSPEFSFSQRTEILNRIWSEMEEPYRRLIKNLIVENQVFYRRRLNSEEENFLLFKKIVSFCSEKVSRQDRSVSFHLDIEHRITQCELTDQAIAATLQGFSSRIKKVSVIRWPQLPLNPFDLHFFNALAYLVECTEPLGLEEFHNLKVYYRNHLKRRAVMLLREHPQFLSSVDSDLIEHWGGFPGSSDLLYFLLGESERKTFTQLERKRIETRTRSFQEQLAATLGHPRFGRMDLSIFPLFLFNALRVLIFSHEFIQGKWQWPVTPDETVDFLIKQTPLLPPFPHTLAKQFENALYCNGSFNERLLPKSCAFLTEMLEISQTGRSWESLEKLNALEDEQRLTISVAIITSNRPSQLERCLHSLTQLVRPPEELVIVDNGLDPLTQAVVENFQATFPVHYSRFTQPGVAGARNRAAQAATGEIIAFLDDDACVAPDWLERLERVFLRDPQIGLAAGATLNMKCGRADRIWRFMEAVEKI